MKQLQLLIPLLGIIFFLLPACEFESESSSQAPTSQIRTPKESTTVALPSTPKENLPPLSLEETAEKVLEALSTRDLESLASLAHPKGIRFCPQTYLSDKDIILTPEQLNDASSLSQQFSWGVHQGSGEPIRMDLNAYFQQFIWDKDYRKAPEKSYAFCKQRGNTLDNCLEVYPGGICTEFHFKGSKEYGGMDWKSLKLVFLKEEGVPMLLAIIHSQYST